MPYSINYFSYTKTEANNAYYFVVLLIYRNITFKHTTSFGFFSFLTDCCAIGSYRRWKYDSITCETNIYVII
jgi:hypothetical protein